MKGAPSALPSAMPAQDRALLAPFFAFAPQNQLANWLSGSQPQTGSQMVQLPNSPLYQGGSASSSGASPLASAIAKSAGG